MLYSVSLSSDSDVACLFAKHSAKSLALGEISHTADSRTSIHLRLKTKSVCMCLYKPCLRAYVTARRKRNIVYKYNLAFIRGMVQIWYEVKATLFHFTNVAFTSYHICTIPLIAKLYLYINFITRTSSFMKCSWNYINVPLQAISGN